MNWLKYIKKTLKVGFYIALPSLLILLVKIGENYSIDGKEFAYGVPIQIENKLEDDILVSLYPVRFKDSVPIKTNTKQVRMNKMQDDTIYYYIGKSITNLKDVAIGVTIWKISDLESSCAWKKPYMTKIFYDPDLEVGPDKYNYLARIVVNNPDVQNGNVQPSNNAMTSQSIGFDIEWVYIDEPDFKGYMSKYETTNYQYCDYLNKALACGDIRIDSDNIVYGNSGGYKDQPYFKIASDKNYSQISYNDGIFEVVNCNGYDMSNYPVVEVSWYGAMAFCEHYNYRLPTKEEWQAAADFDGSYKYGYGITENPSLANYTRENPLSFCRYPYTTPVGYYGCFGYGLADITGNVWELTNTYICDYRAVCGGGWDVYNDDAISNSSGQFPNSFADEIGFRVCR